MNASKEQIKAWPPTYFELERESRKITGYHLFMIHYYRGLRSMENRDRYSLVYNMRNAVVPCLLDDDSDIDSTDSWEVSHMDLIRHVSDVWNDLDLDIRECWKERATLLNSRPLFGQFRHLPKEVGKTTISMFSAVQYSMIRAWGRTCKVFRSAMMNGPSRNMSEKQYAMGCAKKTKVGSQSFRRTSMEYLIHLCLFGHDYTKLHKKEIIHKRKGSTIVHIASLKRLKKLFTMSGKCAIDFSVNGLVYNCAGKVNIIRNGRNVTGFIIEEEGRCFWKVQLSSTSEVVTVMKAKYVWNAVDGGKYVYPHSASHGMKVTYYWPVRMKFQHNGIDNWSFLLNRIVYNERNNIIVQKSS